MTSVVSPAFFLFYTVIFFAMIHLFHQWIFGMKLLKKFPPIRLFIEVGLVFSTVMLMDEVFLLRSISPKSAMFGFGVDSIKPDIFHGPFPLIGFLMVVIPFLLLFLGLPRWKYLAAVLIPLLTTLLYAHQREVAALKEDIPDLTGCPEQLVALFEPKGWISVSMYMAMLFVFRVAPFVVAALLMGKTFSKVRYVLLVGLVYAVIAAINSMYDPYVNESVLAFQGAAMISMALLFFELPYLRQCVERIVCPTEGKMENRDVGFLLFKGALSGFVVLLVVCLIGFVRINLEGVRMANRTKNVERLDYPADQVDGLTLVEGTVFSPSDQSDLSSVDYKLSVICMMQDVTMLELMLAELDRQALAELLTEYKEPIVQFENIVRNADYLGPVRVDDVSQLRTVTFHQVGEAFSTRALVKGVDGDLEGALEDIQLLYKTARLLYANNIDSLYKSSSIEYETNGLVWNLIAWYQDNPEKLALIAQTLSQRKANKYTTFPIDSIIHYEGMGKGEVSIGRYAQLDGLLLKSIYDSSQYGCIFYDHLVLMTAVLRYKHQYGVWPEKLELLTPEFLEQIPTEPFRGDAYVYQYDEDGMVLKTPTETGYAMGSCFPFPISGDLEMEKKRSLPPPPAFGGNL